MSGPTALDMIALAGPEWVACWERIVTAVKGSGGGLVEEDPGEPAAGVPMSVMERYARMLSDKSNPQVSLGMTLPIMLVTVSAACQGAIWTRERLENGKWLEVPVILQSTMLAPSGYGKSTVLDPMVKMIRKLEEQEGIPRRIGMARTLLGQEVVKLGLGTVDTTGKPTAGPGNDDAFAEVRSVFDSGYAVRELAVDSATPEGLRNHLVESGGVLAVLAAEPDILQETSRYAKDAGTFRWFLNGWDAASAAVTRAAAGHLVIPRVALPYAIVLQPAAFDQFLQSQVSQDQAGGGLTASGVIARGVYGRSWMTRLEDDLPGTAKGYGLGGAKTELGPGELSETEQTELTLEDVLSRLMARTDEYRVRMGVYIGWKQQTGKLAASGMPTPGVPDPLWLPLADDAALLVWGVVQNIRVALKDLLLQLNIEEPGTKDLIYPMASRWTQQVMRVAAVLQLGVDPDAAQLEGWAFRDAALRICPWLFEQWCAEMRRFRTQAVEMMLEQEMKNNPRKEDQTFGGQIVAALKALQLEAPVGVEFQVSQGTVVREAMQLARARARGELSPPFNKAFQELVAKGALKKVESKPTGKPGKPVVRWERTPLSAQFGF